MTDITRKRGDTYADVFIIKNAKTGLPVNLTGYTFKLTVDSKRQPTDTTTRVYTLTGTILNAAEGTVEFPPSELQADQVGTFFFDAQMIDPAGRKRTFDSGKYVYKQDITKD